MPDGIYLPRESRREPLWDRVDKNRRRFVAIIVWWVAASSAALTLLFGTIALVPALMDASATSVVRTVSWTYGATAAFFIAVMSLQSVLALARSERWLTRRLGAGLVATGELLPTKYALKDMSLASGLPVAPALYAIDTPNVNALVFQAGRRRPVVVVTRGLVDRLTTDEQRAVFANLCARIRSGDAKVAGAITALMRPLWWMRDVALPAEPPPMTRYDDFGTPVAESAGYDPYGGIGIVLFPVVAPLVFITEAIMAGHRKRQLEQGEVADAEGMLLLKDPRAMLSALERCVELNNHVPGVGAGFGQLFFCWTGDDSTDDAQDPEWRRVSRLREVLGVEGVRLTEPTLPSTEAVPVAPRVGG